MDDLYLLPIIKQWISFYTFKGNPFILVNTPRMELIYFLVLSKYLPN